jgi:hypothetical protein
MGQIKIYALRSALGGTSGAYSQAIHRTVTELLGPTGRKDLFTATSPWKPRTSFSRKARASNTPSSKFR